MLLYIFRVIYGKTGKLLCLWQLMSMGQKIVPSQMTHQRSWMQVQLIYLSQKEAKHHYQVTTQLEPHIDKHSKNYQWSGGNRDEMSGAWGDSSLLFLNLHSEREKLREREKPRDGEMGIFAGLALICLWLWANLTKPHRLLQKRTLCTLNVCLYICVHTACWRPGTVEVLDTASESKWSLLSNSADLLFFIQTWSFSYNPLYSLRLWLFSLLSVTCLHAVLWDSNYHTPTCLHTWSLSCSLNKKLLV